MQTKIQAEVDKLISERDEKNIILSDRSQLIYTEAVILESLRLISSPIVPHVASQDSSVAGYHVDKGTLIFLNNYELNMSPKLWNEPEKFEPSRFIVNNQISKPEYFIPFGFGRRSCMGYQLVQMLSFATIANLMKDFNIMPINSKEIKITVGSLAEKDETFKFSVVPRHWNNFKFRIPVINYQTLKQKNKREIGHIIYVYYVFRIKNDW